MLNPSPILPIELGKPRSSTEAETPSDFLPPLWNQMAPASRRQLSQRIAEMIRRIHFPNHAQEVLNEKTA